MQNDRDNFDDIKARGEELYKNLFFWSLIPFWGIETTTKKRRLYAGDLESD